MIYDTVEAIRTWPLDNGWYVEPISQRYVRLGNVVSLGNDVSLGNVVSLGDDVSLGDGVRLGDGDYLQIGPLGSRRAWLVVTIRPSVLLHTGCRHCGLAEFKQAVEEVHGHDMYGVQYRQAIAYIESWLQGIMP